MVQIQTPDPIKPPLEMVGFDDYFRVPVYKSITFLVLFILSFVLTLVMFVINIYKTFQITHHQRVIMRQATQSFRRVENTEMDPDLLLDIGRHVSSPCKSDFPEDSSTVDSLIPHQPTGSTAVKTAAIPKTAPIEKSSIIHFKSSAMPITSDLSGISTMSKNFPSSQPSGKSPGRQPSIGTLEFETPPQDNSDLFQNQFSFPSQSQQPKLNNNIINTTTNTNTFINNSNKHSKID